MIRPDDESYRLLFEANPHPMWVYDAETLRFLAVNEAASRFYGYSRDEFLRMSIAEIRPPEDILALLQELSVYRTATYREGGRRRHQRKNGAICDVETISSALTFAGRPARVVLVIDTTDRLRLERSLRRAEARYRSIFENAVEGIFQTTADGRYIDANPALARIYGYDSPQELIAGLTDIAGTLYVESTRREEFARLMREHGVVLGFESRIRRKDGSIIWISESSRAVHDGDGVLVYYEGFVEDITERKQAEEQIRELNSRLTELATVDELTGLNNRRYFVETLRATYLQTTRLGLPLSVVLLDVDHFKTYNDAFGHPAGDEVLRNIGRILRGGCRETDVVARHGGEEFVVVLPATDDLEARVQAERLRAAIAGHSWPLRRVTASFGIATLGPEISDPESLLEEADRALYQAKHLGRDRVIHARDFSALPSQTPLRLVGVLTSGPQTPRS